MRSKRIAWAWVASFSVFGGLAMVASTPAEAWYCSARGTTGASGWGTSRNLAVARNIALRECAVRTPRGARCLIMYCN